MWQAVTKNNIPNNPYTIEGIPVRVSAVVLITFTSLFPFFAYSVRYTAENTPTGTAISNATPIMINVLIIDGSIDTLSLS